MRLFSSIIFVMISLFSIGQDTNLHGDYIVDFAPFSPPEQALMIEFIGKAAPNFRSSDLKGVQHTLSNYKGQDVILAFWSIEDPNSNVLFNYLEKINDNPDIKILSYCYENHEKAKAFLTTYPTTIPVMPKGKFLGEMVYGHGLGTPRMFFISKQGIVKDVLPASTFNTDINLFPLISDIVSKAF